MASPLPHEEGEKSSSKVGRRNTDDHGPVELFRAGKDDGRCKGNHFKQVLESSLDSRESPSEAGFNLLHLFLVDIETMETPSGPGLTSCTIYCADRSKPQSPTRLIATPTTSTVADTIGFASAR